MKEFIVTGEGYSKTDENKQIIQLIESFLANTYKDAVDMFNAKFSNDYKIVKIYTVDPAWRRGAYGH